VKGTIKKVKLTTVIKAVGKHTMPLRHTRKAEVQLKSFLTSALEWVVNFTPLPLYPGKYPWYSSNRRLMDPRSGLDVLGKRKISYPYRDSNPGSCSQYYAIPAPKKAVRIEMCSKKGTPYIHVSLPEQTKSLKDF